MSFYKKVLATALVAGAFTGLTLTAATAQDVTIVVNGQTLNFDQPPVERAGRVFVPLRGVFERLGASVVYASGQINATGNNRNIALHIGSNQATVNGQPVTVDVAPFLVGARTLVPLRFIAQSLGATVNYNDSSRTVAITGGAAAPVAVTAAPAAPNYIRVTSPAAGTHVGGTFTISGKTRPGSSIEISATSGTNIGGIPVGSGTFNNTTTADATGYFSLTVHVAPIPGGRAAVTIQSVAPNNGGKVVKQLFYPI